jgi:hypothetical protein
MPGMAMSRWPLSHVGDLTAWKWLFGISDYSGRQDCVRAAAAVNTGSAGAASICLTLARNARLDKRRSAA